MALPTNLDSLDYVSGGAPFNESAVAGLSMDGLDVVSQGAPFAGSANSASSDNARVTQIVREVLRDGNDPGGGNLRVTQIVKEVISGTNQNIFVTQIVKEVLRVSLPVAVKGTSWNVFQEDAVLDVYLATGTLASAASDLEVLNGANMLLVGNEIIQFRDVTPLGSNRYRLSYLLRGRFGTEWAMNSHGPNERVILLTADTIRRVVESTADLNQVRFYKAVSDGQILQQALTRMVQNTGISLKPYAPVHVTGSRDGSNNLTISWVRRARVNAEWRDYVDIGLAEDEELYEVDVINPSTGAIVRTLTATTTSAVYSAADQTTDLGAPAAIIPVIVYQKSALVGRGYGTNRNL